MKPETEAAFERLRRIDWENCGKGPENPEIRKIFSRFLSTSRSVIASLGEDAGVTHRFGHLFGYIGNMYLKSYGLSDPFYDWAENTFWRQYRWRGGSTVVYFALQDYLLWFELPDSAKSKFGPVNTNPHESLIQFLEAGGAFTTEHNMLDRLYP